MAEVQQNSNVTYRVYDYGRVGADGKPRALHIEKALDVTRRTPPQKARFRQPSRAVRVFHGGREKKARLTVRLTKRALSRCSSPTARAR